MTDLVLPFYFCRSHITSHHTKANSQTAFDPNERLASNHPPGLGWAGLGWATRHEETTMIKSNQIAILMASSSSSRTVAYDHLMTKPYLGIYRTTTTTKQTAVKLMI
jgi:hypothetical protein